ncbi:hypothetical protein [Piscinibacter koreensis]|uniref:Uncharacterized protein n=1 Tax=Piscinibacter koreensis TaxID=2742824 RepID=A0A7Y6NRP8_9BURK|nr:hypothetical protein [Schlegelella koreensis]NUZ08081.1 hypothetical protein [Schlegelella koreensis]
MNHPATLREALLADLVGDVARLLDRVEALRPALTESTDNMTAAQASLLAQLAAFDSHIIALAEKAKIQTVKYILARTDEAAKRTAEVQVQAMNAAAKELFLSELEPALRQAAAPLLRLEQQAARPWIRWLTHAATAAAASASTWALVAHACRTGGAGT